MEKVGVGSERLCGERQLLHHQAFTGETHAVCDLCAQPESRCPITEFNQEDHLVWWATCVPEVAGTDPATLRQKALDLGFSTLIPEQQEQFPALAR